MEEEFRAFVWRHRLDVVSRNERGSWRQFHSWHTLCLPYVYMYIYMHGLHAQHSHTYKQHGRVQLCAPVLNYSSPRETASLLFLSPFLLHSGRERTSPSTSSFSSFTRFLSFLLFFLSISSIFSFPLRSSQEEIRPLIALAKYSRKRESSFWFFSRTTLPGFRSEEISICRWVLSFFASFLRPLKKFSRFRAISGSYVSNIILLVIFDQKKSYPLFNYTTKKKRKKRRLITNYRERKLRD